MSRKAKFLDSWLKNPPYSAWIVPGKVDALACCKWCCKGSFKKYVRWGEEGGDKWKTNKNEQGEGVLACVYVCFFKKDAEVFKMKFYSYSPVFAIDYNGSMKY